MPAVVNPVTNEFVMVVPIVIDTEIRPGATASRNASGKVRELRAPLLVVWFANRRVAASDLNEVP